MKKYFYTSLTGLLLLSCSLKQASDKMAQKIIHDGPVLSSDIMTPEVLWSIGRVGEPVVSPQGDMALFPVSTFDIQANKSKSDLYILDITSRRIEQLTNTEAGESEPQWRPDGKKIGFLYSESEGKQMWEMDVNGKNRHQLTSIEGGIKGFKYSSDMSRILFVRKVKLDKDIHDLFPDLPEANARIENDIMYRHWDQWHDYSYKHIFWAEYHDGKLGEAVDIMEGERYDSPMNPFGGMEQINWSPDGKHIAYTCKKLNGKAYSLSTNSEIYLYNVETGVTTNFTEGNKGYDRNPVFSPDGRYLAWESMERDGYESDKERLFVGEMATGQRKDYSKDFDQNCTHLHWSKDSQAIYFISDIHAREEIYRLGIEDGRVSRITNGTHDYNSVAETNRGLIAKKVSMSHPAELYLINTETGKDEALTEITSGIMDQLTMGRVEERWIKTTDNKDMLTWVIYPPHFDPEKKYPAILYCQGGPQGTVSQFWSYRWNFQMMAAYGYIVVAPNRRGLPGFGMEWLEQISKDYGGQNIKDYLSAIDAVAAEPYVDENRLGAVGASYGGFSVNYLAGHHNGRFKAFISHAGIFNFEQMYATTEEVFFENWDIGGPFWDKQNKVAQKSYTFSPHHFVDQWDTPILVIHGAKDFRVPEMQGMAVFNTAVLKGVPAQFLYFPEENHWISTPQNGILWQRVFQQWLDRWLK